MSDKSSENYLDNLLGSINGAPASETTDEIEQAAASAFGAKGQEGSDDAFLREFEAELESDAYKDYFADFEMEMEAEQMHELELLGEENSSGIGDGIESIIQEIKDNTGEVEAVPAMPDPSTESPEELIAAIERTQEDRERLGSLDDFESVAPTKEPEEVELVDLDSLESLDEFAGLNGVEQIGEEAPLPMTEAGEPDLAGISDDDLFDMLARQDGLEEIGEMLGKDASGTSVGDDSAFEDFAQQEMDAREEDEDDSPEDSGRKKRGKKDKGKSGDKNARGGFFEKLKTVLFGDDEDDEEDEDFGRKKSAPAEKSSEGATAQELSDENMKILQELEGEDKGAEKKGKKEPKKKKEKKPPKEKKPKEKKPPKPPKEKKPKEKDNTPPLPKGPVIMIFVMVASLVVLILLGTNLVGYQNQMTTAKKMYINGNYTEAYAKVQGVEPKEEDLQVYYQMQILATVDSKYQAYLLYSDYGDQVAALDALVCAAGRYDLNLEDARKFECEDKLEAVGENIADELSGQYGMSMSEAIEIYNQRNRTEYTIVLNRKIQELGLN